RLLGAKESDIKLPELDALDTGGLDAGKFKASEPEVPMPDVPIDIAQDLGASGGKLVSSHEAEDLDKLDTAHGIQETVRLAKLSAGGIALVPDFAANLHFWGIGATTKLVGGTTLANIASFAADVATVIDEENTYEAGLAAKIGGYARREQDWAFQRNVAAG